MHQDTLSFYDGTEKKNSRQPRAFAGTTHFPGLHQTLGTALAITMGKHGGETMKIRKSRRPRKFSRARLAKQQRVIRKHIAALEAFSAKYFEAAKACAEQY